MPLNPKNPTNKNQVSKTLVSILADHDISVVCMVSIFPTFPVPLIILWDFFELVITTSITFMFWLCDFFSHQR